MEHNRLLIASYFRSKGVLGQGRLGWPITHRVKHPGLPADQSKNLGNPGKVFSS